MSNLTQFANLALQPSKRWTFSWFKIPPPWLVLSFYDFACGKRHAEILLFFITYYNFGFIMGFYDYDADNNVVF